MRMSQRREQVGTNVALEGQPSCLATARSCKHQRSGSDQATNPTKDDVHTDLRQPVRHSHALAPARTTFKVTCAMELAHASTGTGEGAPLCAGVGVLPDPPPSARRRYRPTPPPDGGPQPVDGGGARSAHGLLFVAPRLPPPRARGNTLAVASDPGDVVAQACLLPPGPSARGAPYQRTRPSAVTRVTVPPPRLSLASRWPPWTSNAGRVVAPPTSTSVSPRVRPQFSSVPRA